MSEAKFSWIPFYKELAQKVLEYKDKRKDLMDIVYSLPEKYTSFLQWRPEDGSGVSNTEFDPFSFFGIFNRGWTIENRKEILSFFKKKFSLKSNIPEDFEGIPVLDNRRSFFITRNAPDFSEEFLNAYWELFEAVVTNSDDFQMVYDQLNSMRPITYGLTFMMYCINPDNFFSLDTNSRNYLRKYGIDIDNLPNGKQYCELRNTIQEKMKSGEIEEKTFSSFSQNSWKQEPQEFSNVKHWTYAAGENSRLWGEFYKDGIMAIGWDGTGNLNEYDNKEDIRKKVVELYRNDPNASAKNDTTCLWQFANEIHIGDIIYVKHGRKQLFGRGIVESDYYYDETRNEYQHCRKVKWTDKGEWNLNSQTALKTLTDISRYTDLWKEYEEAIQGKKIESTSSETPEKFPLNQILYGPPGTGKTYETKKTCSKNL